MAWVSSYTQEMADAIIEWISEGKPLREFCRQAGKPAFQTVYGWLERNSDFDRRFARARDIGADAIAQEALAIADTPVEGVVVETDDEGKSKEKRGDMLGHRKLQVETRLKLLAKWNPKKYGDKLALGGDSENPLELKAHVNLGSPAALQRAHELLARALAIGSPSANAQADPNGPLLPVEVCAGTSGHGTSVAAGENPGSAE